jgi:dynein heavy chain, axonemal
LTWQKGAKRQMANLDRFLEELQSFDEFEMSVETIKILEDRIKRIDADEGKEETQSTSSLQLNYTEALTTLNNWIKGVIKYHSLMIKRVKPLHAKVQEIEQEVKEADQKLATLNRKSEVCYNNFYTKKN